MTEDKADALIKAIEMQTAVLGKVLEVLHKMANPTMVYSGSPDPVSRILPGPIRYVSGVRAEQYDTEISQI